MSSTNVRKKKKEVIWEEERSRKTLAGGCDRLGNTRTSVKEAGTRMETSVFAVEGKKIKNAAVILAGKKRS